MSNPPRGLSQCRNVSHKRVWRCEEDPNMVDLLRHNLFLVAGSVIFSAMRFFPDIASCRIQVFNGSFVPAVCKRVFYYPLAISSQGGKLYSQKRLKCPIRTQPAIFSTLSSPANMQGSTEAAGFLSINPIYCQLQIHAKPFFWRADRQRRLKKEK